MNMLKASSGPDLMTRLRGDARKIGSCRLRVG